MSTSHECTSDPDVWESAIRCGVKGERTVEDETAFEFLLREAAGTFLPSGFPVLSLLYLFDPQELMRVRQILDRVGLDVWCLGPMWRHAELNEQAAAGFRERNLVTAILEGTAFAEDLDASTSESICALLAVGRFELLPEPYTDTVHAWDLLNEVQRRVVRDINPHFRKPTWQRANSQG